VAGEKRPRRDDDGDGDGANGPRAQQAKRKSKKFDGTLLHRSTLRRSAAQQQARRRVLLQDAIGEESRRQEAGEEAAEQQQSAELEAAKREPAPAVPTPAAEAAATLAAARRTEERLQAETLVRARGVLTDLQAAERNLTGQLAAARRQGREESGERSAETGAIQQLEAAVQEVRQRLTAAKPRVEELEAARRAAIDRLSRNAGDGLEPAIRAAKEWQANQRKVAAGAAALLRAGDAEIREVGAAIRALAHEEGELAALQQQWHQARRNLASIRLAADLEAAILEAADLELAALNARLEEELYGDDLDVDADDSDEEF
jgi:hypothetical protein